MLHHCLGCEIQNGEKTGVQLRSVIFPRLTCPFLSGRQRPTTYSSDMSFCPRLDVLGGGLFVRGISFLISDTT